MGQLHAAIFAISLTFTIRKDTCRGLFCKTDPLIGSDETGLSVNAMLKQCCRVVS